MSGHTDKPGGDDRRMDDGRRAQVPVEVDRRLSDRRSGSDRRGTPRTS